MAQERIMAEGTSLGSEVASVGPQTDPNQVDAQASASQRGGFSRESYFSSKYDRSREDYQLRTDGHFVFVVDPTEVDPDTGQPTIVGKFPKAEGGGAFDRGKKDSQKHLPALPSGAPNQDTPEDQRIRSISSVADLTPEETQKMQQVLGAEGMERLSGLSPESFGMYWRSFFMRYEGPDKIGEAGENLGPEARRIEVEILSQFWTDVDKISAMPQTNPDERAKREHLLEDKEQQYQRLKQEGIVEQAARRNAELAAEGGGSGKIPKGPEWPEEPEPPEGNPNYPEYIWSPELTATGTKLARKIIHLEGKDNGERYNEQNGPELSRLYKEWRVWTILMGKRSIIRQPFRSSPEAPKPEDKPVEPTEPQKPDELLDAEGNPLPTVTDLYETYKKLRDDPTAGKEGLDAVKQSLSRYFNEAQRLKMLDMVDDSLRALYIEIRKGLKAKKSPAKIRKGIKAEQEEIDELGEDAFARKQRTDRANAGQIKKLAGVWNIYTDIAIDKFTNLLTIGHSAGTDSIEGEFDSSKISVEEIMQVTSAEALRERVEDDDVVQSLVNGLSLTEIRELVDNDETLYQKLIQDDRKLLRQRLLHDRDEAFRILASKMGDRRRAAENEVADLQLYGRMGKERKLYWRPMYASYYEVTARTPEEFQIALETFTNWLRRGLTKSPNEIFQRVSGFKDALTTAGVRADVDIVGYRQELEGLVGVLGADFANEHYNVENYRQFLEFLAADEGPDRFIKLSQAAGGKVAAVLWKFDHDPRLQLLFAAHGSRGQLQGDRDAVAQKELRDQILALLYEEIMALEIKDYDPRDTSQVMSSEARQANLEEISKFKPDDDFKGLFEGFDGESQALSFQKLSLKYQIGQRVKGIRATLADGMHPRHLSDADKRLYAEFEGKTDQELALRSAEQKFFERLGRARRVQIILQSGVGLDKLEGEDKIFYETAKNAVDLAFEMYGASGEKAKRGGASFLVDRTDLEDRKFVEYIQVDEAERLVQFAESWTEATYGGKLDPEVRLRLKCKGLPAEEVKNRAGQARRMAIWALKAHGRDAKLWDFTLTRNGKAVDPNTCGYSKYGVDWNKSNDVEKYRYAVPNYPMVLGFNSKGEQVTLVFDAEGKPIVNWEWDNSGNAIIYDQPSEIVQVPKMTVMGEELISRERQRIIFDNLNKDTSARQMMLKAPVEQADGTVRPGLIEVNFSSKKVRRHPYAGRSRHPYPGYQEEDTALMTQPETFAAAGRIQNGDSSPEKENPHASQLLMIDPTLDRVTRVFHKETVEDRIILAVIESSYQSHWRVNDELYQVFLPDGPFSSTGRTAYGTQDFGGSTKMWYHSKALAARWPDMETRRLGALVNVAPLHYGAMSDTWGADGLLDAIRMFGYKQYRMVGLFALQKWVAQTEGASDVFESLYGFRSPQEKKSKEGLFEKPTNDADRLWQLRKEYWGTFFVENKYQEEVLEDDIENKYLNAIRESLGRLEVTLQRMRVLETDMRGERAPLWLEGVDIYERNPDGSIKTEVEINTDGEKVIKRVINPDIYTMHDSGSGRHSESLFFWRFVNWLRSREKGGGQAAYSTEALFYQLMDYVSYASLRAEKEERPETKRQTRWAWLLGKLAR